MSGVSRGVSRGRRRPVRCPTPCRRPGCSSGAVAIWRPAGLGEVTQAAGGGMPVHPGAAGIQQDRPAGSGAYCPVEGPADCWRQRHQHDLGALAAYPQHPVAVLLAEVVLGG